MVVQAFCEAVLPPLLQLSGQAVPQVAADRGRAGSDPELSLCSSGVLLSLDFIHSVCYLTDQGLYISRKANGSLGFGFHSRFSKISPILKL